MQEWSSPQKYGLVLIGFSDTFSADERHTPGLALHTTVAGKCPSSPEDEQEKQGKNRDRFMTVFTSTPKENKKLSLNTLLVFGLRLIEKEFTAGSSGSMEALGALRIFERSLIKRGLQYTEYYGDGDSKGFLQVKDIYGENSVTKLECIGHIQKKSRLTFKEAKKEHQRTWWEGEIN
ncbi:uncharacterized protein TNCV_3080211 [Trichonephila clavipes]|nr:uncharacterized protein TNCV_3080211 [Trichonephila clavipes]